MSDQVALALITTFGGIVTALLGYIAKEISGLRTDIRRHDAKYQDHEERITHLERHTA
jgi:biopolymer transport protein ExbB/TolQ